MDNIILLTKPEFFSGEAEIINALFRTGLPILHMRKPHAAAGQVDALIAQIAPPFRDRIVMHNHDLHSCHTLEEVRKKKERIFRNNSQYSYLFLSPIFDSISKQGYRAAFTEEELRRAHSHGIIDHTVIALGGITPTNARKAIALGFGGVAVLGDIWQSADPVSRFKEYKQII